MFRSFTLVVFSMLLHHHLLAQYNQQVQNYSSGQPLPQWNGTDAVVHRAGDKPYSLYHLAGKPPRIRKQPKDICMYLGFYSGMWIPKGNNRILGSHPLLGLSFGQWINRFNWDFNMEFQLGGTSTSYDVMYNGVSTPSHKYGAAYVGLNFGYSLVQVKNSVLYMTAGLGGGGFKPVAENQSDYGVSIDGFNRNFGLGLQHFGKKGTLTGVTLLYNVIGYQNPGGTRIDGDAITVKLFIGGFE